MDWDKNCIAYLLCSAHLRIFIRSPLYHTPRAQFKSSARSRGLLVCAPSSGMRSLPDPLPLQSEVIPSAPFSKALDPDVRGCRAALRSSHAARERYQCSCSKTLANVECNTRRDLIRVREWQRTNLSEPTHQNRLSNSVEPCPCRRLERREAASPEKIEQIVQRDQVGARLRQGRLTAGTKSELTTSRKSILCYV